MKKYHLNKKGDPGLCSAETGNCPFGGDETHYSNLESATNAAESKFKSEHGFLAMFKRKKVAELSTEVVEKVDKISDNWQFSRGFSAGLGKYTDGEKTLLLRMITSSDDDLALNNKDYSELVNGWKTFKPEILAKTKKYFSENPEEWNRIKSTEYHYDSDGIAMGNLGRMLSRIKNINEENSGKQVKFNRN